MFRIAKKNNLFVLVISVASFVSLITGIILMSSGWLMGAGVLMAVTLYFAVAESVQLNRENEALSKSLGEKSREFEDSQQTLKQYTLDVEKTHAAEVKRLWVSDGVAGVTDILRGHENSNELFDQLISYVVRHLDANQGGIFVAEENELQETEITLKACYAYDRKKFVQKKFAVGEGLVGQCFLEGETIYITQLKESFISITSGLGGATPRALLLVPLKTDVNVTGIIEIASFTAFMPHQIEFVEKLSAICGAALNTLRVNEQTRTLLQQSQMFGEQIKAQEEVMRQSMEELMATQEEMRRKESHLQGQMDLMEFVIDNVPFPVFIKDETGHYVLVNKANAALLQSNKQDIIGYDDSKFIRNEAEMQVIRESDKRIIEEQREVHLPEQQLTLSNGRQQFFKTSKIPFVNPVTGKTSILGVSLDLTDIKNTERKLGLEISALKQLLMAEPSREGQAQEILTSGR
jgi:PAS domain S-box-containing protein